MKQQTSNTENIKWVDNSFLLEKKPLHAFTLKTRGNFLWRLWFLVSAPFIWLIKGEVIIK